MLLGMQCRCRHDTLALVRMAINAGDVGKGWRRKSAYTVVLECGQTSSRVTFGANYEFQRLACPIFLNMVDKWPVRMIEKKWTKKE